MALPADVDANLGTDVEQVNLVDLVGVDDTVVGVDGCGAGGGVKHGLGGFLLVEVGDAIATVDAEVEAPVVGHGIVESEVGNEADAILFEVFDIALLVCVVDGEAVVGQVAIFDVGGGEVAADLISAFVGFEFALHRQVDLCTEAEEEEPALAHGGAPVELDGHGEEHGGLGLPPVEEAGGGVVGAGGGVGGVDEAVDGLGVVEGGGGAAVVELGTEPHAEVLAEEVHVLQLGKGSELRFPGAIGGVVEQGVETAAEVEADIVAVPVGLGLSAERESQDTKHDNDSFHG